MIEIIIIATFSVACFFIVDRLSKVIKLEKQILFLILGILFGLILRKTGYGSFDAIFPKITQYNMAALMFMFFVAGFTINIKLLKKSGSITAKMFTIPPYFETAVMSVILFSAVMLVPSVGYELKFIEAVIIAAIFSTASPANIIPVCSSFIQEGYTDKNNIPGTIILASIIDSFAVFPIVFAAAFILIMQSTGADITFIHTVGIIFGSLVAIILALAIGILIGRVIVFIASIPFKKLSSDKQTKYKNYFVILLAFALASLMILLLGNVDILRKSVSIFGILIMCGIGASINHFDNTGVSDIIRKDGNKLFNLFGMPVIFIYVGSGIDIGALLDIRQLLFFTVLTLIAVCAKGIAAKFVLRDKKYSPGERKFAALCYIPKGMALINFTVIFGALLSNGSSFVSFMTMLATISVIVSMSVGLPLITRAKGRLIKKHIEE